MSPDERTFTPLQLPDKKSVPVNSTEVLCSFDKLYLPSLEEVRIYINKTLIVLSRLTYFLTT